ncbi:MAG: polysaccharide biosynthesis tyrosine autokinase [Pseudomonadota bacterium]
MNEAAGHGFISRRDLDRGAVSASAPSNDFVLNLSEIARLLRQGVWVIGTSTFLGGLISAYLVLQITPTYTATSQILLGQQSLADDALGSLFQGLELDNQEIAGQIAIMRSGPILTRVSETLGLDQLPEFNAALLPEEPPPGPIAQAIAEAEELVKSLLGAGEANAPATSSDSAANATTSENPLFAASQAEKARLRDQEDYVSQLSQGLRIRQQGSSALVNISFASPDRITAAAVVNTVADQYIDFQLEEKFDSTRRVTDGLNERITDLELRLEAAERAVLEFRDQMLGTESGGSERLEQQIRELSSRLVEVSAQRAELDAELREIGILIESQGTLAVAGVLDSALIQQLQSERAELQLREAQLRSRFGDETSRLADMEASIARTERALSQEVERLRGEMAGQAAVAAARETSIGDQLRELERRYLTLSQQLIRLAQLEREAEASRLVYETFLTTFTQTSEVVGLQEADVRVVSYAKPPPAPSAPNKKVSVALGLVAGLFAGIGLVFLRALTDSSIDSVAKLRRILGGVPVVSAIPRVRRRWLRRQDPIKAIGKPSSEPVAEAIRKLRNTLLLRRDTPGWKVAVVSAEPAEGKTTTCLMLARAAAQAGKHCVVVETDLRRSSMARVLGKSTRPDLVDVLAGKVGLYDALVQDKTTGAWILLAQPEVQDPAAVLWSERMSALVAKLETEFDLIIFDTPPLLRVSDALPILRHADDTIMVVRWKRSQSQKMRESLDLLQQAGVSLTCAVMTMTPRERMLSSYGRYSYGGPVKT